MDPSSSSSSTNGASSSSIGVSSSSTAREPAPLAIRKAAPPAATSMIQSTSRYTKPGGPNTTAGARTSASPTTPPRPVGKGQAPLCGQQLANPAAVTVANTQQP